MRAEARWGRPAVRSLLWGSQLCRLTGPFHATGDLRLLSHWAGLASWLYPTICVPLGKSPDISEPTRVTPGLLVPKSSLPTECWHLGGCVGRTTVRLEKGSSYCAWDSRVADTWPRELGSGPCE